MSTRRWALSFIIIYMTSYFSYLLSEMEYNLILAPIILTMLGWGVCKFYTSVLAKRITVDNYRTIIMILFLLAAVASFFVRIDNIYRSIAFSLMFFSWAVFWLFFGEQRQEQTDQAKNT